jgi:hypothetical protein
MNEEHPNFFDAAVAIAKPIPSVRSSFGRIAPLDTLAKAELDLCHYGWRHAQDGHDLPTVASMARIVSLICTRQLSYRDAVEYEKFERKCQTFPRMTIGESRDLVHALQGANRSGQLDMEEAAALQRMEERHEC